MLRRPASLRPLDFGVAMSSALRQLVRRRREERAFKRTSRIPCDAQILARDITRDELDIAFRSEAMADDWRSVEKEIERLGITDQAGGVNPGDRRAIYYFIRHFKPREVLEIGTHIGASTTHIAAALREAGSEEVGRPQLTTVDIVDVNDRENAVWLEAGSTYSPLEMARRLSVDEQVMFIKRSSLEYFADCQERFDFIFLDGDHTARTVYQEVPAALQLLHPEGLILLHDYFPELRPLWADGSVIRGPWLATERLRTEGANLKALPLGDLPWPTKLGSNRTSLALLVRE
jgi:predicted O-methyltransferase YrrM